MPVTRRPWFELHDQPWFPAFLRDLVTQALEAVWNDLNTYRPIAPLLRQALHQSAATRIVDLCSGGGGPWLSLYPEIAPAAPPATSSAASPQIPTGTPSLHVLLTDLYPSRRLLRQPLPPALAARPEPVDATCLPPDLTGFRTLFSAFHHFGPAAAQAMLADAFRRREGIAIFEGARRSPLTLALVAGVPLVALKCAALARPFRWRRFLFTWLLPVVPAILYIDGVLSCLRSYSLGDLRELTRPLAAPDYQWHIGDAPGPRIPIRYLIGTPTGRRENPQP